MNDDNLKLIARIQHFHDHMLNTSEMINELEVDNEERGLILIAKNEILKDIINDYRACFVDILYIEKESM